MNKYILVFIIKKENVRSYTPIDKIKITKTIKAKNLEQAKKYANLINKNKLYNHYELKHIQRLYK